MSSVTFTSDDKLGLGEFLVSRKENLQESVHIFGRSVRVGNDLSSVAEPDIGRLVKENNVGSVVP
jgi:hypothetical protein